MFKKVLVVGLATLLSCGVAFASGGVGLLDVDSFSHDGAIDSDYKKVKDGGAFGISGAGGLAGAEANGFVVNGVVKGEVSTVGGGLTSTETYKGKDKDGVFHVGSFSQSQAQTGGSVLVKVNPGINGFGIAGGKMFGIAGQGTLNASYLGDGPKLQHDGFTGGIAGQGSIGLFTGKTFVMSGGDYYYGGSQNDGGGWYIKRHGENAGKIKWFKKHPENESEWSLLGKKKLDSKAKAELEANITMYGSSFSDSYRVVFVDGDVRTEQMGTIVGANTVVKSVRYDFVDRNGCAVACARLCGGWVAVGGAASKTIVEGGKSTAVGIYFGSGQLGQNYKGSADGYTYGAKTTVNGMKGSIVSGGAGMTVKSVVTGGYAR